jgi:hypothetical protein
MFFQEWSRWVSPVIATSGMPAFSAFDEARDEVRRAGSEGGVGDTDAVRDLGIGIGGEDAPRARR